MLVENYVLVPLSIRNIGYYKSLGYSVPSIPRTNREEVRKRLGTIMVKSTDVVGSKLVKLDFVCDCCGERFQRTADAYLSKVKKTGSKKTYCTKCYRKEAEATMVEKYGVRHACQLPEVKKKIAETNIAKYGKPYPMQVEEFQEKSKETCLEKYGVDSYSKTSEFKEVAHTLFDEKNIPCSKAQKHICDLIGGELNYKISGFFLDILYEDWLDIEYDGSGHKLRVARGYMTEAEFEEKESRRYAAVHASGIKTLTIVNDNKRNRDALPQDEILLQIISEKINSLKNSNKMSEIINLNELH